MAEKTKQKQLKVWNGRGAWIAHKDRDKLRSPSSTPHMYIAAYSVKDAEALIEEYVGYKPTGVAREMRVYFAPMWGRIMDGITPERGIWLQFGQGETPVKVI